MSRRLRRTMGTKLGAVGTESVPNRRAPTALAATTGHLRPTVITEFGALGAESVPNRRARPQGCT